MYAGVHTATPASYHSLIWLRTPQSAVAALLPRLVLHDEKLLITVLALRRSKEDRASWPQVQSLPLAVRALELVSIETRTNSRHGVTPNSKEEHRFGWG